MMSLQDSCNLFSTCQGLPLRSLSDTDLILEIHNQCWLMYHTAVVFHFLQVIETQGIMIVLQVARIWNSVIGVKKLEMTKLLGWWYSQQQGLHGKECCLWLPNFTAACRFLKLQFDNLFNDTVSGVSTWIHCPRVTQSGLVVNAAQVNKSYTILRFETKGGSTPSTEPNPQRISNCWAAVLTAQDISTKTLVAEWYVAHL